MDPLSIAASAVALASLAARLSSILSNIRSDYVTLPARLHAVNNEVQDLRVVLNQIAAVVKEREAHGVHGDIEHEIPHLLDRGRDALVGLEHLLNRIRATGSGKRELLARTLLWRKQQGTLALLQDDIKRVKSSINILIGASNSRDMMRIRMDLEQTIFAAKYDDILENISNDELPNQVITTLLEQHHADFSHAMRDQHAKVEQRLARVESLLLSHTTQMQESQISQIGVLYDATRPPAQIRPTRAVSPRSEKMIRERHSDAAVGFRLRGYSPISCRQGCICCCHTARRAASPSFVKQALGQLFIGYAGLPILSGNSSRCDSAACQKRQSPSISVEYWFPVGFFWSQIVRLRLAYETNVGPSLQLSTLRHVSDSAQCVSFAFTGNIEGLKSLFGSGMASPRDVSSTRGYSLLRWAMFGQQYEMCKFLMTVGADPSYRPISQTDDCPQEKACDYILRGGLSPEAVDILRIVSEGTDFIESQKFSTLHKIVLRLPPYAYPGKDTLVKELELLGREAVDAPDTAGRTALYWASARGDESAIVTLLSFGADPNAMDKSLSTPIAIAATKGRTITVRLLLEAGAAPDPPLPKGVRLGSPLNGAARNAANPMLLKTLLDFGADIEASGVDGMTPLLGVARSNSSAHAALLLEYGADINAQSRTGGKKTVLTAAIEYNNHGVLKLLLAKWFVYGGVRGALSLSRLLGVMARNADVETMRILTAGEQHLRAILQASNYDCSFPGGGCFGGGPELEHYVKLIVGRADGRDTTTSNGSNSTELVQAFNTLVSTLNGSGSEQNKSMVSKMESGLLSRSPCEISERILYVSRVSDGTVGEDDDDDDDKLLVFEDAKEHLHSSQPPQPIPYLTPSPMMMMTVRELKV